MKKIILLFCLALPPLSSFVFRNDIAAQTCEQILADAQNAAEKGDFKGAVLKYLAAQKLCPVAQSEPIQSKILNVFTKIEALKKKAEDAEKAAKTNLQKAKDAETKALAEQAKTKRALNEAQAANIRVVASYLKDIDQHILKLEYDNALEKCQTALDLKVDNQKDAIQKRLLEIAYFYTETDTLNAAIKTLKLLNINSLANREDLLKTIRQNSPPQYFTFLDERYYPKMIEVEGGTFTMGFDKDTSYQNTPHPVKVSRFRIAETETTVWQYFLYLNAIRKKSNDTPTWQYSGDNPMVYVSWLDAQDYFKWLNERRDGGKFRLPTEAEWEFAARGGNLEKDKQFAFSGSDDIEEVAWYTSNSSSRTQSVKRLKRNALGLYDMSGNVWEWCADLYSETYYKECLAKGTVENPQGAVKGNFRSLRGGSWSNHDFNGRVSSRDRSFDVSRNDNYGFRSLQDK